jgi:hypothetical protein
MIVRDPDIAVKVTRSPTYLLGRLFMGEVPNLNRQIHLVPPAPNPSRDLTIPLLFAKCSKRPYMSVNFASEQHFYSTITRMVPLTTRLGKLQGSPVIGQQRPF